MNRDVFVQTRADFMASLSNATPLSALEELIWNALDADAREVKIDLIQNALSGLDAVRISDDGVGVDLENVDSNFGSLGGSWKREQSVTAGFRRKLHGRHGRGRFKAFQLGLSVEWRTTSRTESGALISHVISGDYSEIGLFHVAEQAPGPGTGTEVFITNIRANATILLDAENVVQTLASKFALYLKAYPNVRIYFAGIPITPVIVQKSATTYNLTLASGAEAKLELITWRRRFLGSGKLVFCGKDGFSLYDFPANVRLVDAESFTAYLISERFTQLQAENALMMDELHPEVRAYLDAARKVIREHFGVQAALKDRTRVAAWIEEGSYPFKADDESVLRGRFDEGLKDMRAQLTGFEALTKKERTYLFDLLYKTVKWSHDNE